VDKLVKMYKPEVMYNAETSGCHLNCEPTKKCWLRRM